MLPFRCFSMKVSVSLHQKGVNLHLFCRVAIKTENTLVYTFFRPFEPRHVISNNVAFWRMDSDELVQPPCMLRNSNWCLVSSLTVIEYSSNHQRLWSDCAYAQADLNLCWLHIPHCWKSHIAAHLLTQWDRKLTKMQQWAGLFVPYRFANSQRGPCSVHVYTKKRILQENKSAEYTNKINHPTFKF